MTNRDKNIVGQILAKTYRIERFLGVGTVGTVYVARHVRSGGLYAVKVLHRKLAASPDLYQRFQDEARLIATLRHPHILPITDFDRDENGIPFFVMDLLEGENLQQRLKHKESFPIALALETIQQVGSALHTAHRSGIIHRNVKPENIFLVRHDLGDRVTETAKVMDFGLARFRRMAPAGTRDASLGVSAYMAPELLQETNAPIDGRADQWALSVIAYRMLSGRPPFEDDNPEEMLRQILNEPPRPFPRMANELPAHMVAAIHRGMSKRREDRYETMMDFVRALSSRSSQVAAAEVAGDAAAPQARPPIPSGRVAAPMPPLPSGSAQPPPLPSTASTPPPVPSGGAPPANIPRPIAPAPSAPVPAGPAAIAPSGPMPSAASPPRPPPRLVSPPLLIPEESNAAPPPPPRGPSWGLLLGGGVVAVLAGVGLTLLWEQRQHPRPQVAPPTITTPRADIGGPSRLVVEPLVATPSNANPPTAGAPDGGARGVLAPHIPVPPLRPAIEEIPPPAVPPSPLAPPTPVTPPATLTAPTAPTTPTAHAPGSAGSPPSNSGVAGTPPSPSPTPATKPQKDPSASAVPAGTASSVPAAQPTPPPIAAPQPPPAAPAGQQKSRDEVEELLGGTTSTPKPPTSPGGTSQAPATLKPNVVQKPPAARPPTENPSANPSEPAEKTADKLLEEAQAAYVGGERQHAIDMALQVTRTGNASEVTRAWRFIGSAACSVRSSVLATRAYNNLSAPEHRQLVAEICKRNGLTLSPSDGQFITE